MQEAIIGQVWFVKGNECETPYATKLDAEIAARYMFPDEDASMRYARIYYREVVRYA